MRKYEAMIVLDIKGKEESGEQMSTAISNEFTKLGAKLTQIDRLGLKKFPTAPRHVEHGYYVNFYFDAEPATVSAIEAKLKLNENVYQQVYLRA
jgi:small subunit ribosomal protein S6